jgi:hypothetical protein
MRRIHPGVHERLGSRRIAPPEERVVPADDRTVPAEDRTVPPHILRIVPVCAMTNPF